ncbi:hypothetical protein [Streptomyces cinereospinus]|uniref:DUF3558 domain-containing protein n=1 Tax=Streptomyces cinereospinus TaxID=285561 RepID=A0ABV5MUM1_9ACTN
MLAFASTACGRSGEDQIPEVVCGTRIDQTLLRPVLTAMEDLQESSRVDRTAAVSAPCTLYSAGDRILELHFYWSTAAPHFAERSEFDPVFEDLPGWRAVSIGEEGIVGNTGAMVSGPCVVGRNTHFILKLSLPEVNIMDESRRQDIEKFMRAYFPATVATLSCD